MTIAIDQRPTPSDVENDERKPCHTLDEAGRPICGASRFRTGAPHTAAECEALGHTYCKTCESLAGLLDVEG